MTIPYFCTIYEYKRPGVFHGFMDVEIKQGGLGKQEIRVTLCDYHANIVYPERQKQKQSPPAPEEQQK